MHCIQQERLLLKQSPIKSYALRWKRITTGITYEIGDIVYYKLKDSNKLKGPRKVIGKEDKQILVKHDWYYIRVHPCSLQLVDNIGPTNQKGLQETLMRRKMQIMIWSTPVMMKVSFIQLIK